MIYTQQELLTFYSNIYGLNKSQLALDLGVTRQTIYDYYSGNRKMPTIYKKFIALDLSIPSQFLDFEFIATDPVCPLTKQRLHGLPF